MNSKTAMIKRKTLILVLIVLCALLLTGLLFYVIFYKENDFMRGMIRVIEKNCNGREVTEDEYNKLNSNNIMFYPFEAVLQKPEYYNNEKCALYLKYKQKEIVEYSNKLNADLENVVYYQESYLPDNGIGIEGLFQIEIRDYQDNSVCSNAFNLEYANINDYYQKLLKDGYKSDFGSYERYSSGIIREENYIIYSEYQEKSNNIWGEILAEREQYYIYIKYSFDNCDEYYNDLCYILDYIDIPHPKDIEMN